MDIEELIRRARAGEDVTSRFAQKTLVLPVWEGELDKEYYTSKHPVMNTESYPDIVLYDERDSEDEFDPETGEPKRVKFPIGTEKVSRVTYDLQALSVKRLVELCFGIPVKRAYKPVNDRQKDIARHLEAIFTRTRIDSVNIERGKKLFASCEVMTLWYGVKQDNTIYGFNSKLKLRCQTYSPMQGDTLYPLFDETGDLVALSISYRRRVADEWMSYFDTYTSSTHLRWQSGNGENDKAWELVVDESIEIGKIPAVYTYRPTPAWENASPLVYEMEWAVSRNGNYLRTNSRPILAAFVDEAVKWGQAPRTDGAFRDIVQYPAGSSLQYVTWNGATENLKYYVDELRQMFFTQLQLPDWSYENMKTSPMSGEARKQLFIDAQLKVKDESGRLLEFFDREVNVVKAFLKSMLPQEYGKDIDELEVQNIITPFTITDEKDSISVLMTANGGQPLMSQRESIELYGKSDDVEATINEIRSEKMDEMLANAVEPSM